MRSKKVANVFLYGFLGIFLLIALLPVIWVITSSFKTSTQIFQGVLIPERWVTSNYPGAWARGNIGRVMANSLIVTLATVALGSAIDVLAGYSFAKLALKKHNWIFYLFLLGLAVPLEANVFSIFLQIRQLGLVNTHSGLVLALVGTGTAFGTFLMRNFFKDISDSFGESAKIDGASEFTIFFRVYLPMAAPAIGALAVFKALQAWNEYNLSLFLLTNQRKWTIPLATATFRSIEMSNYGFVFASAVMSFLPIVIFYIIFNRSFVSGIALGGEKG